jgi:hypothetical protein
MHEKNQNGLENAALSLRSARVEFHHEALRFTGAFK